MDYKITADTTISELMHEDSSDEFVLTDDVTLDELVHHGTKGQKWGIRRYQNRDGSLTAAGKKRYLKMQQKQDKLQKDMDDLVGKKGDNTNDGKTTTAKKRIGDMTDDEIRERTNRLNLEKSLREAEMNWTKAMQEPLTKAEKRKNKTKDLVGNLIEGAIRNIGGQTVTYLAGTLVNKTIGSAFGDDKMVNPKKGQKDK